MRRVLVLSLALVAGLLLPAAAQATPPANTSAPTITGFARESQTLTSDVGVWTGTDLVYKRQWLRCDRLGANCAVISSTAVSYTVTAADVGSTLRVRVEGRNSEGVAYSTSAATAEVTGYPPSNTAAPVVSGNLRSGQTLATTQGTWSGTQPFTYSYSWRRCDATGANCVAIAGASGQTYTLTDADIDARIRVQVTATNTAGNDSGSSAPTVAIGVAQPPVNTVAPSLIGIAQDAQGLRIDYGTWTGVAPLAYTQSWWRCDGLGAGCVAISGSTGISYTLTPSDVTHTIKAVVTVRNTDGAATVSTALTAPVALNPPGNTTAPTVTGAIRTGQTLTAGRGAWSGTPDLDYFYQWVRCNSDGAFCGDIVGATNSTYVPTDDDLGSRLGVQVTASNPAGSSVRASSVTGVITPAMPPVNSVLPTASGLFRDGQTLAASTGTWTGTTGITYTRNWLRCNALGASCAPITGATATSYKLTADDVSSTVRVEVRATNADGTQTAQSSAQMVAPAPPTNTAIPTLGGLPRDQERLTVTNGTWAGTPTIAYGYAWERCDAQGANCAAVPGATSNFYDLSTADIGLRVRVKVTGTNAGGSLVATSVATIVVEATPPVATVLPSITGTMRDTQTLTADKGVWSGTAPITYAYQWRRCNLAGAQCVDIAGATSTTYRLQPADVLSTIRIRIQATNVKALTPTESAAGSVVVADKPAVTTLPSISGPVEDGGLLTASAGVWTGTPTVGYSYQWLRCATPGDCTNIPGAIQTTYRLTTADIDSLITVRITAVNGGGATSALAAYTAAIAPVIPGNLTLPTIGGTARDGQTLTSSIGSWSGTVPQTRYLQWRRCDPVGDNCVDIPAATQPTYTLTPDEVGKTVRLYVVSVNAGGAADAISARTAVVAFAPPVSTVDPAITGELKDGRTLSVANGVWTGTPTIAFAYQWQRCTGPSAQLACTNIDGAASQSYTLRTADVDTRIQVVMKATNNGGIATKVVPYTGVVSPNPPVNSQIPVISGIVRDGEELLASDGLWTGVITFAYDYQWYRCDENGANCGRVNGATTNRFLLTPTDVGLTLKVEVIARNAGGSTSAMSEATTVGTPRPPANIAQPKIAGHTGLAETLTADDGGWLGSPPLIFTRAWLRCDSVGDGCVALGSASRTYQLTPDDLGATIRLRVTVSNAAGAETKTSDPTRVISTDFPVNTELPTAITGSVFAVGVPLTALVGQWGGSGPFETFYKWRRCNPAGDVCADIPGATDRIYVPVEDDLGKMLRISVTRDNGVGAATATSQPVGLIKIAPPALTIAPTVKASGALLPGADLSAGKGTWIGGAPITYSYVWLRCNATGGDCVQIPGVGDVKYTLTDADVTHSLRVRVSASNSTMTVPADSEPIGPIQALPPVATKKPSIGSDAGPGAKPRVGSLVRGDGGEWAGTAPIAYAYRWQRCASATDCADIPGATLTSYTATDDDAGARLRFVVSATNAATTVVAASLTSDVVAGTPPSALSKPSVTVAIGGLPRDGSPLVAEPGGWSGTGTLAFTYQWQRCPATGAGACKAIAKATDKGYTAVAADVGSRLSVLVSAKSAAGKADAQSAMTEPVAAIVPVIAERPSIRLSPGEPKAGSKFTGTDGKWTGTTPMTFTYQWLHCDKKGKACQAIDSATKAIYDLLAGDFTGTTMNGSFRIAVVATNAAGATTATSQAYGDKGLIAEAGSPPPGAPAKAADAVPGADSRMPLTSKSVRVDSKGRLVVSVTCKKGKKACAGTMTVKAPGYSRVLKFKGVKSGKTRRWVLKLKRGAQKAGGKAKGGLSTTITMAVKGEKGYTRTVKAKVPKKVTKRWKKLK